VATVFIAGTLMNTAQSSMPALAAAFYPTRGRATGVAWMLGIGRFGGIAGSFLVAELSARHLGFSEIFTAVAVPGLVATVVLLKDFAAGRPAPPPPGEPADPGRTGLPLIRPLSARLSALFPGDRPMIIDVHGHYTTAPAALGAWRDLQIAGLKDPSKTPDPEPEDQRRRAARVHRDQPAAPDEAARLDLTIFSPRASFMAHHIGDFQTSATWAAICNELCYRVASCSPTTSSARPCCRSRPAWTRPPAFPSWRSASRTTATSAST
jgi:hypothetical protein